MPPIKYFYKGQSRDFIIFVESEDIVKKYLKDSTIPLVDVVGNYTVYTSQNGHGPEGILEEAPKQELASEFGNTKIESVIQEILEKGYSKHSSGVNKSGYESTNDSRGASSFI